MVFKIRWWQQLDVGICSLPWVTCTIFTFHATIIISLQTIHKYMFHDFAWDEKLSPRNEKLL